MEDKLYNLGINDDSKIPDMKGAYIKYAYGLKVGEIPWSSFNPFLATALKHSNNTPVVVEDIFSINQYIMEHYRALELEGKYA